MLGQTIHSNPHTFVSLSLALCVFLHSTKQANLLYIYIKLHSFHTVLVSSMQQPNLYKLTRNPIK